METEEKIRYRAAGVVVKDNCIVLIKRHKKGEVYYIFPGGGVEKNETVEDALKRELKEELNIIVKSYNKLFEVIDENKNTKQIGTYFMVKDFEGEFELGGPEKNKHNEHNQYHIELIPLEDFRKVKDVLPIQARENLYKIFNV